MPKTKTKLQNQRTQPKPAAIVTGRLPVVSCALCPDWVRAYDPAETTASAVLTEHYNGRHSGELANNGH